MKRISRAVTLLIVCMMLYGFLIATGCISAQPAGPDTPGPDTTPAPAGTPSSSCRSGHTLCDGTCLDLRLDAGNCSLCGHACGQGESCRDGQCVISACSGGELSDCNMTCVLITTDPFNCGSCGNRCSPGQVCTGGLCIPAP